MSNTFGRKWPAIDIMRLYERGSTDAWNKFLQIIQDRQDVEGLKKTLYGIQAGMADAVKAGLVTDEINLWFVRMQRSLEMTAKRIFRKKYPHPLDNPLNAGDADALAIKSVKQARDQEFERFLREASF
jgi:hypothetical protein